MDNTNLQLRNINQKDSGIYTCVAQNKHGRVAKNFTVRINEPILVKNIESPTPDLIIPNNPENTTVEKDGRAMLDSLMLDYFNGHKISYAKNLVFDPTALNLSEHFHIIGFGEAVKK